MIRVETMRGDALRPYISALAHLRTEVFATWPYLYEGSIAYEEGYLASYIESPGAAVILAMEGDTPVGAATCQPLSEAASAVQKAFIDAQLDPTNYCYFGESVLLKSYRGQGIGVRFFQAREAHARFLGAQSTSFCAVRRRQDDPRRPPDYTPLDRFWAHRGYTPLVGVSCRFSWKEPGQDTDSPHDLDFWHKRLESSV